jgi:hypothetical protein
LARRGRQPRPGCPLGAQFTGQFAVIHRGRHPLLGYDDFPQHILRQSGNATPILGHPLAAIKQDLKGFQVVIAQGELQLRTVGTMLCLVPALKAPTVMTPASRGGRVRLMTVCKAITVREPVRPLDRPAPVLERVAQANGLGYH